MNKDYGEIHDWVALSLVDGLGNISYRNLIKKFGSPSNVFQASVKDLEEVEGLRPKVVQEIKSFDQVARVKQELELMHKHGVTVITFLDENYSSNLLTIYDPPPF